MHFLQESMLWCLPAALLVLSAVWGYGAWRRRRDLAAWLGNPSGRSAVEVRLSRGKRHFRQLLLLLAVTLLLLAAARPWWGSRLIDVNSSGSDVLVIVDVSKSMLAEDVAPSRLEHAKWLLGEVIRKCPDARFGIIAFAGNAFVSCPLTGDPVSLEQCIAELNPDLVPVGGTDLAKALKTAMTALNAANGSQRTILLLTDGEELHGSVAGEIEALKRSGIRLLIAGLGDPNVPAPIPETDPSGNRLFKRDARGELVRTTVNEPLLRKLAAETGGLYFNTSPVSPGTERLVQYVRALERDGEKQIRRTLPIDRFMPLLAAALILYLLYGIVGEAPGKRRRRGGAGTALLIAGVLLGGSFSAPAADSAPTVPLTAPETAAAPAQNEPPPPAPAPGTEAPLPREPQALYNLAREAQLAGDPEKARELYAAVIAAGTEARAEAFHNSGVLEHAEARRQLERSRQTLQNQQPDGALQTLQTASAALDRAEEHYVNAMTARQDDSLPTAAAQQLLLNDRAEIEKLKKAIEDLQKRQQEAQQQTQQAQQENQREKDRQNQQNQPQNRQGQQGQQNQPQNQQGQQGQQGQQNQQGQQGQQGPQNRPDALQQAQQSAQQLQQQAKDLGQQQLSERAGKASEALQKAERARQRSDYDQADRELQKARQELGAPDPQNGKDGEKPQNGEKPDGKDGKDGEKPQPDDAGDRELPPPQEASGQPEPDAEKPEGKSADALLDLMSQDEKLLRDAIRKNRNRGIRPVEKDW